MGQLLLPREETRKGDEDAVERSSTVGGCSPAAQGGSGDGVELGVLDCRGALASPRCFMVRRGTGEDQELTLAQAKRLLALTDPRSLRSGVCPGTVVLVRIRGSLGQEEYPHCTWRARYRIIFR